jgi:predicted CXXCH cytochrome family protein
LVSFKKLLAEKPEHHGPIADGDCTSCHGEIHGGEHFRLLTEDYPTKPYVPYDEARYALCFGCHDSEAFAEERTDDATEFRNGDQNLHFIHVNRTVKGRTCRLCHEVHASKKPKQISEAVPFGEWEIPINFEKTSTGGTCLPGCHRRYRYDRQSPVVNVQVSKPDVPPASTRSGGQTSPSGSETTPAASG